MKQLKKIIILKNSILQKAIIIAFIVIFYFAAQSCQKITPDPEACFDVDIQTAVEQGYNFKFTNCSNKYESLLWDFGDETTSSEENPQHVFTSHNSYKVRLTATNKYGERNTFEKEILYGRYRLNKVVFTKTWDSVAKPKYVSIYKDWDMFTIKFSFNSQLPWSLAIVPSKSYYGFVEDAGSIFSYFEADMAGNGQSQALNIYPSNIINNKCDVELIHAPSDTARFTMYFEIAR